MRILCALLCAFAVTGPGFAQDARQSLVSVSVVPDTVTVGQPFAVRVRVRAPKVATVRFPEVPEPANGVDPLDPRALEEGPPGEFLDLTAVYTFVAWDVGTRGPALTPVVVVVGGREQVFPLSPPAVTVRSLLPADTTQQAPRDARAPVQLPGKLWQYLVVGVVLLAALAWFVSARRKWARTSGASAQPEAWDQARAAFASLDALQLAESGEPGRHAIAHVDVMRSYIERRFPSVATTLDGSSASAALADLDLSVPVQRVATLLERDGELRFAHADVAPDEAMALASEAREITANLQLAHEARLRALERPPRPRRR